jgi:hypothetical protein
MTLDGRNRAKIRYSEQDMKADLSVKLRPLTAEDLDGANAVIEAAIRTGNCQTASSACRCQVIATTQTT